MTESYLYDTVHPSPEAVGDMSMFDLMIECSRHPEFEVSLHLEMALLIRKQECKELAIFFARRGLALSAGNSGMVRRMRLRGNQGDTGCHGDGGSCLGEYLVAILSWKMYCSVVYCNSGNFHVTYFCALNFRCNLLFSVSRAVNIRCS